MAGQDGGFGVGRERQQADQPGQTESDTANDETPGGQDQRGQALMVAGGDEEVAGVPDGGEQR